MATKKFARVKANVLALTFMATLLGITLRAPRAHAQSGFLHRLTQPARFQAWRSSLGSRVHAQSGMLHRLTQPARFQTWRPSAGSHVRDTRAAPHIAQSARPAATTNALARALVASWRRGASRAAASRIERAAHVQSGRVEQASARSAGVRAMNAATPSNRGTVTVHREVRDPHTGARTGITESYRYDPTQHDGYDRASAPLATRTYALPDDRATRVIQRRTALTRMRASRQLERHGAPRSMNPALFQPDPRYAHTHPASGARAATTPAH
jgi:hypothetical protein